ncbi:ubiquinol-cytochrome c reductase complex 7.2 kDa protein, putative [Pediculus humanus corporis]|uniref:Complex III subunit 9 n=1 Tax=Pediculus humanus subsp. corporis TaxID=121224 RepID=E0VR61_PEDHC|nr:ubiquinol-cytochrome c reductase complex 7.2 kDa protein, putative [Pediculus humanus corporis]EEB15867.1 ubiquinol-cytochrome c reductase complex 7.2 kDa protein, putative [Pediculus humanus corporis]
MSVTASLYRILFKRSSTFTLTILAGAFVFETLVENGANAIFEHHNKGYFFKFPSKYMSEKK